MPSATGANEETLWRELYGIIKHRHMAHGHDVIDSINRLLAKHPLLVRAGRSLVAPKTGVSISEEMRISSNLWRLISPTLVTDDEPALLTGAVVVVQSGGEEFLVDGRRRINHWHRDANEGPHRVLVVSIPTG